MVSEIKIPHESKIRVYWDDLSENYSREGLNKVKNYFSDKYGVAKTNIEVSFRPVKFDTKGNTIEIDNASIDNILDVNYQRELFKVWIERENKVVDFDRILKLDAKVNSELNLETDLSLNRKWSIKWIMIDNFLSFGENNFFSLSKLSGLNIVNSSPNPNTGGKSTLTIDSLKFLLHGKTSKTDKNEEIFNQFTDKNELVVRGMLEINSNELIIERKMKRTPKKGGGWMISNKVNYYTILPDGEELEMNDEDAIKTTQLIKNTIGGESDFELVTLATARNLEDLIDLSASESGKILTRFIGLEVIEKKEEIVREMYNKFTKTMKSNSYDITTLTNEIITHDENILSLDKLKLESESNLEIAKLEIIEHNKENDRLLNSKEKIDVTITALNPSKLENDILKITEKGNDLKTKKTTLEQRLTDIGVLKFDEDKHYQLTKNISKYNTDIALNNAEINRLNKLIEGLVKGGICQSCNRKLDDVDHSGHINENKTKISGLESNTLKTNELKIIDETELLTLNKVKVLIDEKNKVELEKDRIDVELGSLRNDVVSKKNDLNKYNLNLNAIEYNRKVDSDVSFVKTKLAVVENTKDVLIVKIGKISQDIKANTQDIEKKTKLIDDIKKEVEIEKIFKIYIEMIGKKGVSKIVLRSVLPIINSEVERLLEDVCDFKVEIFMDDKNEVQYLLIKDDVEKLLKSGSGYERTAAALSLRSVLGKVSRLSTPNFITFDEVLGKVADENIVLMKPLFDKIKSMYDVVFLITHNPMVKDWADNIVTVIKEKNISRISLN